MNVMRCRPSTSRRCMPTSPSTERILVELEDVADALLDARFVLDYLLANCETDTRFVRVFHIKGLVVLANKALTEFVAELKHTDDQDAA